MYPRLLRCCDDEEEGCWWMRNTMSRSNIVLPPYPVQLGSIKFDSCEKRLHEYVKSGNYVKAKQMLKKGILPDSVNSLGQTPLFVAALLGLQKIVDLLLEYGSNPNQRCFDWSTPVHAAAFSCNQWIMSQLIDAGGDLRLHDEMSRRPYDWAIMAGRDQHAQMLEFIDQCSAHMHVLIHGFNCKSKNIISSQELINSSSLIGRLSPRKVVKSLAKDHKCKSISIKRMCSFGYGELFLIDRQVGFIATVPLIEDKSVVQDDCKPAFCFAAGPYTTMTNLMWGCTEVTVKGLKVMTHENCSKERFADLLIEEQKNISNLHHPFILHLLAVCTSSTLERTSLVFERINFGSLYHILHEKRSECPILPMETILNLLLQAIDALMFLHWRGFVHCSFSSHAIQVVSAGQAKISHFEYMIQSNDGRTHNEVACFPIPDQLYRWSSPEIILRNSVTMKSDLYSFCAVMQESLTDCLPWDGLDAPAIKHAMVSGRYLEADPRLFKPFDTITCTGLQARPKQRTINLQDIKYLIKNDFKDAADRPTHILRSVNTERLGDNSIQHAQQPCPGELETETMYKIAEKADTEDNYTWLPENKSLSSTEDFEKQDFINSSSSSSSSQHYAYETSLNSDLEEDTDYESSEPDATCQIASQRIEDGLTSILAHQKSTLNNLLYIQEFIPMSIMALHDGETFQQPENVQTRETAKCFPHTSTDEVDGTVPQCSSKFYAGCSAVAPPQLHYVPPDIASDSRNVFVEAQKAPPITQSECFGGTRRKTIKKNGKTPQNPVTTQIYTCVASNMSGNSESEDDALFGKRYDTKGSSTQQLPTISFNGHRKASDWSLQSSRTFPHSKQMGECASNNERGKNLQGSFIVCRQEDKDGKLEKLCHVAARRCPSPVDEESCATVTEIIPPADTFKDTDDSSETSYFTPELELSVENSQEKHSNSRGQDTPEQSSSDHSESSILTTEERNQTVCYARNRTFEKDMPIVTTFSLSPDSRSIIDVEGLSTILLDLKSPAKHFTPSKSIEASTRHSTPVNQATCSKIRPLQKEKSLETSCWESLKSYKSTKSSVTFLSAEYDDNFVDQLQEKVTDVQETFIKNQGLVCIVGSLENSEGNNLLSKTDCECQNMDISSLSSENEKTNNCG
ncbi:inactive serine/threonine-protein kinase TEX14 isoform X2 [Rana temporaria]|uniref:inactive serine/threonine-protein kinase TEX14 isoform X2 n=1 Tax=Rana temporaria TaxID=8407 RepID=UPI001AAE0A17|nr:inactive serine/threonine-protein kinase TEX14 isoform X2 [Rana temporaria]